MTNGLNQLQIQAAEMVAKGLTDVAIAESLERSRRWVQSQKQLPEFMELVEEFNENFKQATIEQNIENTQEDLRISQRRIREIYNKIFKICDTYADKLTVRLESVDPDDLKANQLAQSLKQLTDSYQNAINIETQFYGLERIIKELEKVRKLGALD